MEKINDPMQPETVFLGLIFVSFFPLKNLPNNIPPISEAIATKKERIIKGLYWFSVKKV